MHPPITPSLSGSATTSDMDLYVTATGSDTIGDGSITNPYATPLRAYSDVPRTINHAVHVHIGAGSYGVGSWPFKMENSFGDSGFISFDGSSAMTEVVATKTINAGGWTNIETYVAADITVVGGGMVVNAYKGMFIQYTSGAGAGLIAPITSNTATVIRIGPYDVVPNDGDTFRIVYPGAEIELDNGFYSIIGDGGVPSFYFLFGAPNVFLIGLRFHTAGMGMVNLVNIYSISCVGTIFDVYVDIVDSEVITATLTYGTPAKYIDETSWVSTWDGGCIFNSEILCTGRCYLYCLTVTGATVSCSGEMHYSCVLNSTLYSLIVQGSGITFRHLYLEGSGVAPGAGLLYSSAVLFDDVYVNNGVSGIEVTPGCSGISIESFKGDDPSVTNALVIGQGCNVAINASSCSLVGAGGAPNAIVWSSGAANSAYPVANNFVTDALGAQVVGY